MPVAKQNGASAGYYMLVSRSGDNGNPGAGEIAVDFNTTSGLSRRYGATNVADNKWHFVGFTFTGNSLASGITIYVDGVSDGTQTGTNNMASGSMLNNFNFTIGARDPGAVFYPGLIDDVRVYNRALIAGEVKQLYNIGR